VFGKETGFGTLDGSGRTVVDLGHLGPSDGFVIKGAAAGDLAGWSVSSAGDVNHDGFDDMIIGAPLGSAGGAFSGQAYVVYGKASGFGTLDASGQRVVDLANLASGNGFAIRGATAGDQAGWSVASAGDVNGDGTADLIVGAPRNSDPGLYAGEAYVLFGNHSGLGTVSGGHAVVDLSIAASLSPAKGFVIKGDASWSFAGWSVSSAGDVNGDDIDDLVVGAPYAGTAGRTYTGAGAT